MSHAATSYNIPDPNEIGDEDGLSGLPWGSLTLRHVVASEKAREEGESSDTKGKRGDYNSPSYEHYPSFDGIKAYYEPGTSHNDNGSNYEKEPSYSEESGEAYYHRGATYYEEYDDQVYYDYGQGDRQGESDRPNQPTGIPEVNNDSTLKAFGDATSPNALTTADVHYEPTENLATSKTTSPLNTAGKDNHSPSP